MKKYIYILIIMFSVQIVAAQAKKPSIMIVPSDNWCYQNGYMITYDNQGTKEQRPDYSRALIENSDLGNVITKINGLMQERGFPLATLEQALKEVKQSNAEASVLTSKNSGEGVSESTYDKLMAVVKSDIIIKLGWTVTKSGFNKSIQINIEAIDAYTSESVASANPPGNPSSTADIPSLLSESVLSVIDNFNSKLQLHFDDLFANGRKVIIKLNKFGSWTGDFESEYEVDGEKNELSSIIENWMSTHTVKGRFNNTDATENVMKFEQVRIPMFDSAGKAIDAKDFCKPLQKYLQAPPFNIPIKVIKKGIGQAWLILGDK